MRKYVVPLFAILLAGIFTAFNKTTRIGNDFTILVTRINELKGIEKNFSTSFFEYNWGPQDDPSSYMKVPNAYPLEYYCPENEVLCGIIAQDDYFYNPGHPTQESLDYLLYHFGNGNTFLCEIPGFVEFKEYE